MVSQPSSSDVVRNLAEDDVGLLQLRPIQSAAVTINDALAVIWLQVGKHRGCEYVAAISAFVSQNAVVKQVDGCALVDVE